MKDNLVKEKDMDLENLDFRTEFIQEIGKQIKSTAQEFILMMSKQLILANFRITKSKVLERFLKEMQQPTYIVKDRKQASLILFLTI